MGQMDKLPAVISCCFCCFLRAGSVMIALVSFIAGVILAPNVSHSHGFWDMHGVLAPTSALVEMVIQMILGAVSIMLCIVSIFLLVGALCNMPKLIEFYQWGAIVYSITVFILFFVLAGYCVIVQGNCAVAGGTLVALMVVNVVLTAYFIIVVNSLRMSMLYISMDNIPI